MLSVALAGVYVVWKRGAFVGLFAPVFLIVWHEWLFHLAFSIFLYLDQWFVVYVFLLPSMLYLWIKVARKNIPWRFMVINAALVAPFFLFGFPTSLSEIFSQNFWVNLYEISTWTLGSIAACKYLR